MNYELSQPIKQVIDEYLLKLLKTYGLFSVVIIVVCALLLWFITRKKVEGEVKKEINKHKAEIEFKYGGKIENYKLYIDKKHKAYSEISELLTKTQSSILSLQGMKRYPDFSEFNSEDLEEYLKSRNLSRKKTEEYINKFREAEGRGPREIKIVQDEVMNYLVNVDKSLAREIYNQAKSFFWLKNIYFSREIAEFVKHFFDSANTLLIKFEIPDFSRLVEDQEEKRKLKESITTDLDNITEKMKKELESI